jgi:predicted ATPase
MAKNLRIVVSGSSGSGKSTLVNALARKFGVPALKEEMKDIYVAADVHRKLKKDKNAAEADVERAATDWMKCFPAWAEQRKKMYADNDGFVADRWEADLLSVWLRNFSSRPVDKTTIRLRQDMLAKAKTFSYAIVLPLHRPAREERNEDGLRRNPSFSARFLANVLTVGLIRQCRDLPIIFVPNRQLSVEERVEYVENVIRKHLDRSSSA